MEFTAYQLIMIALAIVIQTAGGVGYVAKIKNELGTRVAVLEAGHRAIDDDLKEIKADVKELLRTMSSS